jgi:MFS family permease
MSTATASVASPVPLPVGRLVGVGAVIFFANAALLVLQLVAGRLLAPYIGSSLETWTSIIGVFLAGIALGNALGGRIADRYPTPRTLAILLCCGAGAALWMLLFPQLLSSTGVYKSIPLGPRIPVLAFALCLPAGFVLSLLTPLAIKLGLPDVSHTGRVAGLIFALSTLGCLLGNYVTGFYFIPSFTINTLVLVAAGMLLALAAVTMVILKPTAESQAASESGTDTPASATPETPATNPHAFPDIRIAYTIVFLASFCGMTLELTASRVLAQYLGVSLFTWTGIIGVMLAGTAMGNFLGGQVADRVNKPGSWVNPRYALAVTLCAAGAGTVFQFVSLAIIVNLQAFGSWDPISQVMAWTFSLFFLPMFALGFVSPQVIRLAVPDVAHVGRVAGRVYAWSTAGAIVGTFAAGYFLLSYFGMRHTILGAALILACTSLLVARVWDNNPMLYLFSIVLGGITGGFILGLRQTRDEGFVAQVESNYYTITVSRDNSREGALKLTLDHLVHSSVDPYDPEFLYYTHEHIQMEFLRLARESVASPKTLVIGGGGYTLPRYAKVMMPECVMDVVEIDPMVTKVAYDHLGLQREFGINHFHMDGRQYVSEKVPAGTYDVIIQDAVNDLSVPAHLMTKEYNDAVKAALKPNGVYLLTIIDSIEYGKLWKAAMATLAKSFPPENIVLLSAEYVPPAGTKDSDEWNRRRRVMVIYASEKPFNIDDLRDAEVNQSPLRSKFKLVTASVALGASQSQPEDTEGPPPRMGIARYLPLTHTVQVPDARLKTFTAIEPGLVLTDQYCPIDNLMAEVFRQRYK